MSISPGSRIASPRSITSLSDPLPSPTPTIRSLSIRTMPGRTISPASMSSSPAAFSVSTAMSRSGEEPRAPLDHRFPYQLHPGRAAVGYPRLLPRLDRKRHHDQRLHNVHQRTCVLGQIVQWELVAVLDYIVHAGKCDVVERLHFRHR